MFRKLSVTSPLAIALAIISSPLYGSSFQTFEQSASSLGMAHSDMASLADDATTAWYNPAGITRFWDTEIAVGVTNVHFDTYVDTFFQIQDSNYIVATFLEEYFGPMLGIVNLVQQFSSLYTVPRAKGNTHQIYGYGHFIQPLIRNWNQIDVSAALSVAMPWGWDTDYSTTDVVSYAARTRINSIAFAPSVGIRLYESLSVAAQAKFERMSIYLSSEAFRTYGVNYSMYKWFTAANVSFLYELNPCFRVGGTYEINPSNTFKGNGDIYNSKGKISAKIRLPNVLTLGFTWASRSDLVFTGTFVYTQWSRLKNLKVRFDIDNDLGQVPPSYISTALPLNFKDAYLGAIGLKYLANDRFTLRTGLGLETASTRNLYREIRFQDANHFLYGIGLNYAFNCYTSFDFGYLFTYYPSNAIRKASFAGITPNPTIELLAPSNTTFPVSELSQNSAIYYGTTKTLIHSFGLQFNCRY